MRVAKAWLQGDPVERERRRFDKFAYSELNVHLLQILRGTHGAVRPNYTWAVLQAAYLAKSLKLKRISAVEFGVAGGNGLISLEKTAEEIERILNVKIDVYGFDTGYGLPKPTDYRDLPHLYEESTYPMDQTLLQHRLKKANLTLGLIQDTLPSFIASEPPPVGFIAVDVDLYSSTVHSLKLLEASSKLLLPRIHCYFDDIIGFSFAEFNGERLAIKEFNETHELRKISPIFGLRYFVPEAMIDNPWVEGMYVVHILDHELYSKGDQMVLHKHENINVCGVNR